MSGQQPPAPHEDYRELFDLTPAAYLVTDASGTVRQANRRASRLLGATGRFLAGRSLSSFVDAEQRTAFRERLRQGERLEAAPWLLRVRPRGGEPVTVAVAVSAARDPDGRPVALRWLLSELPPGVRGAGVPAPAGEAPGEPAGGKAGPAPPDRERLRQTIEEVVLAARSLLHADHVSVMAYDDAGEHRWMVTAGDLGDAFERVRRELAAGPCAEAVRRGRPVWTRDVVTDQRWPGLARALAARAGAHGGAGAQGALAARGGVHGALAAPVLVEGRGAGACLALSASARVWSEAELAAIRAFAAVIAQALANSPR